jgi:hypothetical protein
VVLATLAFPIFQLGAFPIRPFSATSPLSMQKLALLNASRVATLAAAGKVVSFFF